MRFAIIVAASALLMAGPSFSQSRNWNTDWFDVTQHDTSCGMSSSFNFDGRPDVNLDILYGGESSGILAVTSSGWSAVEGAEYDDLSFLLVNPDRDFGGGVATGVVLSYIYKGFKISFPTDFLDALAAASSMIVTKGKGDDQVILTHINLRGSGAAVASLRRCAEHVQRSNAAQARREQRWDHISRDPFATQPTSEEPKNP
ncbi:MULTISPECIES: hypothetical protein [unclassified Brevundimonas]|uniref:hypothetical protein n=1 Tax=unclassified Brevundimonas TaxID=2622653 RepID=UPI0025C09C9C|nr:MULTISPECIES: hypothetical protein [unclassified Brevundimonas]